ncbi:hypothetical protein ACLOJK_019413 [Asimina triloba]
MCHLPFVDALSHVLRQGSSPSAVQSAVATVYSLLVVNDYCPIIKSKPRILTLLINLIRNSISLLHSVWDGLKALFHATLYPLNRPRLKDTSM